MKRNDLSSQRRFAKNAMIVSLGITTISGLMMHGKAARYLHYTAGAALVGFSIWHHQLYPATRNPSKERQLPAAETTK